MLASTLLKRGESIAGTKLSVDKVLAPGLIRFEPTIYPEVNQELGRLSAGYLWAWVSTLYQSGKCIDTCKTALHQVPTKLHLLQGVAKSFIIHHLSLSRKYHKPVANDSGVLQRKIQYLVTKPRSLPTGDRDLWGGTSKILLRKKLWIFILCTYIQAKGCKACQNIELPKNSAIVDGEHGKDYLGLGPFCSRWFLLSGENGDAEQDGCACEQG